MRPPVSRHVLALVLLVTLVLASPAAGQEPGTTIPGATTTPTALAPPAVADDLDGGSPQVFVALSLLGGASALAIMVVQWFRTRPPRHPPSREG